MVKRIYTQPEICSYKQDELAALIEAGACSTFVCHCHYGGANTGR